MRPLLLVAVGMVSVESNPEWFAQIHRESERLSEINVDYRFRMAAEEGGIQMSDDFRPF